MRVTGTKPLTIPERVTSSRPLTNSTVKVTSVTPVTKSGQYNITKSVTERTENRDRQLIIVPGEDRDFKFVVLMSVVTLQYSAGPAAPAAVPAVMTLQVDTRPLLTPLIPTVFGLGAGLGWLLTSWSLTVSELGSPTVSRTTNILITKLIDILWSSSQTGDLF